MVCCFVGFRCSGVIGFVVCLLFMLFCLLLVGSGLVVAYCLYCYFEVYLMYSFIDVCNSSCL